MKVFVIEYATVSPSVLAAEIESRFDCLCSWRELSEDAYEMCVTGDCGGEALAEIIAEVVAF